MTCLALARQLVKVAVVSSGAGADDLPAEVRHELATMLDTPVRHVEPVAGGTQVRVWRIEAGDLPSDFLALRLVKRPLDLLERQARALAAVPAEGVRTARILANRQLAGDGSPCVQLTLWMAGRHPTPRRAVDAHAVGRGLAHLHRGLEGHAAHFADRPLVLGTYTSYVGQLSRLLDEDRGVMAGLGRNKRRVLRWELQASTQLPTQLLHGDLHAANVVVDPTAPAGFLDFDKMMVGPRVFDLAKFISTSCFFGHPSARLSRTAVARLLEGYTSISPLSAAERDCLDALCVVLNVESALCGANYEIPDLVARADEVGSWWARRRTLQPAARAPRGEVDQLNLFAAT